MLFALWLKVLDLSGKLLAPQTPSVLGWGRVANGIILSLEQAPPSTY